jgi:beta-galactosidase
LLNALGPVQTVTLNDRVLMRDAVPTAARTELPVSGLALKPTGNHLRIEATRFGDWSARESIRGTHPASLRISTPAAPWSRSVFNGLAQVIVQSTGGTGEVVLTATSEGCEPAHLSVTAH